MAPSDTDASRSVVVSAGRLQRFASDVFKALGMTFEDASLMAEQIVWAQVRGHDWLGARKIIQYSKRIQAGVTAARGAARIVSERASFVVLDAGDTFSQIAGVEAMRRAAAKAHDTGVGVATVRNTTSAGALGYFASRAVEERLIGIAMNNAPPLMPPWGGTDKLVGNQAFAVGSPAGRHAPLLLDMALSKITLVGIHGYEERGEDLPEGLAFDAVANPTNSPAEALAGMLAPMGGHRGYGLALMWEVLTGVLAGGKRFLSEVTMPSEFGQPQGVSMFLMAIDPQVAMPCDEFEARVDRLIETIHASPSSSPLKRVLVPGERSAETAANAERNGIPMPVSLVNQLAEFGDTIGVAWH